MVPNCSEYKLGSNHLGIQQDGYKRCRRLKRKIKCLRPPLILKFHGSLLNWQRKYSRIKTIVDCVHNHTFDHCYSPNGRSILGTNIVPEVLRNWPRTIFKTNERHSSLSNAVGITLVNISFCVLKTKHLA